MNTKDGAGPGNSLYIYSEAGTLPANEGKAGSIPAFSSDL